MPAINKTVKASLSSLKKTDMTARVRDIERDPRSILRRAEAKSIRVTAKEGARVYHIMTIRHGNRNDPAWPGSLPITIEVLKCRAGRILHLASGLQIALRVQVTAKSPDAYFFEPGSECLEFASRRLGGASGDPTLLKNAVRRSSIVRAASEAAAKQADTRRLTEIKSLQGRIATLERAAKKDADLAEASKKSEAALREARAAQRAADAVSRKNASEKNDEVQSLKSQIGALERALKKQTSIRDVNRNAIIPKPQPAPEISHSDTVEIGSPRTS